MRPSLSGPRTAASWQTPITWFTSSHELVWAGRRKRNLRPALFAHEGASDGDTGQDGTDGKTFAGGGKFLGCGNPEVCHAHLLHVGDLGDGEVDGVGLEVALGGLALGKGIGAWEQTLDGVRHLVAHPAVDDLLVGVQQSEMRAGKVLALLVEL